MALRIGLQRMGRKRKPFYRIVVSDRRTKLNGKIVDSLGYYDPQTKPPTIKVDNKNLSKWISVGAQPTSSIKEILKI